MIVIRKTTIFFCYLGYVILMFFLIKVLLQYEHLLHEQTQSTYNLIPLYWYSSLYPMLIGLMFAIPSFVQLFKVKGRWNFDWLKMYVIGLPSLFGATVFLFYFSPIGKYLPPMSILMFGTKFSTICGIAFGYLVLSCFRNSTFAAQIR